MSWLDAQDLALEENNNTITTYVAIVNTTMTISILLVIIYNHRTDENI